MGGVRKFIWLTREGGQIQVKRFWQIFNYKWMFFSSYFEISPRGVVKQIGSLGERGSYDLFLLSSGCGVRKFIWLTREGEGGSESSEAILTDFQL